MDNTPNYSFISIKSAAINNEPMNETQKKWWWGFLFTIIFTASLSITALIILIYTDYYQSDDHPALDGESEQVEQTIKSPADENSSSFKTMMTMSSAPADANGASANLLASAGSAPAGGEFSNSSTIKNSINSFLNLTPGKNHVTVVDMISKRKSGPDEVDSAPTETNVTIKLSKKKNKKPKPVNKVKRKK